MWVLTGASGWIGSNILPLLEKDSVWPFSGRGKKFPELSSWRTLPTPSHPCRWIHGAFLTQDQISVLGIRKFVEINESIRQDVLDQIEHWPGRRFLYLSSGAVSFQNVYGLQKRLDEEIFGEACARRGIPFTALRVFSLSGPGVRKRSLYLLSNLIDQALAGNHLQINASHLVLRSFFSVEHLAFLIQNLGKSTASLPLFIDVCGEVLWEIGDVARRIRDLLNPGASLKRPSLLKEGPDVYQGNPKYIQNLLKSYNIKPFSLTQHIQKSLCVTQTS